MLLGLITVNLVHGKGQILMYSWEIGLATIVLSLLVASLSSSLGILVSLRASTVRQAQQMFSLAFMLLFIPMMLIPVLPQEWQGWLMMWMVNTEFFYNHSRGDADTFHPGYITVVSPKMAIRTLKTANLCLVIAHRSILKHNLI